MILFEFGYFVYIFIIRSMCRFYKTRKKLFLNSKNSSLLNGNTNSAQKPLTGDSAISRLVRQTSVNRNCRPQCKAFHNAKDEYFFLHCGWVHRSAMRRRRFLFTVQRRVQEIDFCALRCDLRCGLWAYFAILWTQSAESFVLRYEVVVYRGL